ncbi:hypothetical protein E2C01_086878 [Portunus trituberculatus]|uniref:Uncharacterized protein n=1 Tax=Portunus trituberculatus TaxID=210409 RepID=A0A5B7JFT9_PORTR|nr:hypothetical protein [Portunus trituberculatus]
MTLADLDCFERSRQVQAPSPPAHRTLTAAATPSKTHLLRDQKLRLLHTSSGKCERFLPHSFPLKALPGACGDTRHQGPQLSRQKG